MDLKKLTSKNKLNIITVLIITAMLIFYFIIRLAEADLQLYNIYFIIAGIIYVFYILFRAFRIKTRFTTFVSYLTAFIFLLLIMLFFNQLTKNSFLAWALFLIGILSFIIAFTGVIISLFFRHDWHDKKIKLRIHVFVAIAVMTTIVDFILSYKWNNFEMNILICIISVCMLYSVFDALIRSSKKNFLSFLECNYIIPGMSSLLLILIIVKGF